MNKPVVFITGINSFVGSNLAAFLKERGYKIKGSLSSLKKSDDVKSITQELTEIKLGQNISHDAIPDDAEVVIYMAHDKNNAQNNIDANKQVYEIASKKGCQYHLFISSISADSTNLTDYGQVKLKLENFFADKNNSAVIKPGLIIGNGGLFLNMENFVKNNYFIPLPDGGKYPMAVIEMDTLSHAFEKLIETRKIGVFNLYKKELISLNEIVKNIARTFGKRIQVITVPIALAMMFFGVFKGLLSLLNIKNKFNIDSISGYKLYKNLKLPPSDLESLLKDK